MTLNLTELRDEPLGKHPTQAEKPLFLPYCWCHHSGADETEQVVGAAADTHSYTFDVVGLSDEPLDAPYKRSALVCLNVLCGAGTSPWG